MSIFIDNKYTRYYYSIIQNAQKQNRKRGPSVYYEQHHILPVCWFPQHKNDKSNLVLLTAREHWICHRLLTKMTTGPLKHKMIFAMGGMIRNNKNQNRHTPNARTYEEVKKQVSALKSQLQTGVKRGPMSEEAKLKKSIAMRGKNTGPRTKESIEKQRATMTGSKRKPHSAQARANISAALTGRIYEDIFGAEEAAAIKAKLSKIHKGRPKSEETKARMKAAWERRRQNSINNKLC